MYKRKYEKENALVCKIAAFFFIVLTAQTAFAQTQIKGVITDSQSNEPLIGVNVRIKDSSQGVITDIDGNYKLDVASGRRTLIVSYISYTTQEIIDVDIKKGETLILDIKMEEASTDRGEVVVTARQNMEAERALSMERKISTIAVESVGAREMSIKGLSTVADGVKKITGISMEGNSKVLVRGLGDRYSMTSLNGFPIASPNPDNKLIPLTLFPTSVVKNVTVTKVYQPSVFGDYSGAHIDVETKENIGADFINFGISTGGRLNTLFSDFYSSDKSKAGIPYLGVSKGLLLDKNIKDLGRAEFQDYQRNNKLFETTFQIHKKQALPELGLELGAGKSWRVGGQKLNAMIAANFNNGYQTYKDAYVSSINAQGDVKDRFTYNKYAYETTFTSLAQISYTLRKNDMLSYNVMFVNNTEDEFKERDGYDAEGVALRGNNSLYHMYTLLNNQITGKHQFANNKLHLDWQGSYGATTSDEPDRRQVMFRKNDDGTLSLFKLNQQETMRYFSELFEDDWNGDIKAKYLLNKDTEKPNFMRLGLSLRNKSRDFYSANFYYDLSQLNPQIDNIYDTNHYLNQENIQNGILSVKRVSQERNSYYAGTDINAGFLDMEYYVTPQLLFSGGLRFEKSKQWVRYWDDQAQEQKAEMNVDDFFPALSVKYTTGNESTQNYRFSASRTITRPSFLEMAPFAYQESYGSNTVIGNENIQNGYNYNFDVRYEVFTKLGDMYSIGAYYKYLDTPIEQIQKYSGSLIKSFQNVDKGTAAGIELEIRKAITKDFKVDFNASYIYTHISLPKDGLYTDKSRQLQGASPYLLNLDVNYSPKFSNDRALSLSAVYNLQGPRINSVGINGINNVVEQVIHSLDFISVYSLNSKMKIKFQAKNILNYKNEFTQEVNGKDEIVEHYKRGVSLSVGFSMNF